MTTAEDIRSAMQARYPDVDNDEDSIEYSGFIHEHPMTATGVVLISSVLLRTTDIERLAEFTNYGKRFIRAIAANMENSRLWKDGKYDCARWSNGNHFPRDENEDNKFWDDILIAEGSLWMPDAKSHPSEDAFAVFWNIKRVN